jgi:aminotransferase
MNEDGLGKSCVSNRIIGEGQLGYRRCVTCIMDTTDPGITFDGDGRCNHCLKVDQLKKRWRPEGDPQRLERLIARVKQDGKGQDYDVVVGLSGGVDSSYVAYLCKQFSLRALIVHVDTGWNSELAVKNIENLVQFGGFDLDTLVVDWEEMRDLQLAFLNSGVPNQDVPQDHAIYAGFIRRAALYRVRWTFIGTNFACESILPQSWGYDSKDLRHLLDIHRRFGQRPLVQFPRLSYFENALRYQVLHGLKSAAPLNLVPYRKSKAIHTLEHEVDWRYYGGKHYESRFTKFFQAWYLPTKWGYDKRLAHVSSLVVSGQISREEALNELLMRDLPKEEVEADMDYLANKLAITRQEFDTLMKVPIQSHSTYAQTPRAVKRSLGLVFAVVHRALGRRAA